MSKHYCSMCGANSAEVVGLSASPRPDFSGVVTRVKFLCSRCDQTTSIELDGIIVKHLSTMVDQTIDQMGVSGVVGLSDPDMGVQVLPEPVALLVWQPGAQLIRKEGMCPNCGRNGLLSYLLDEFKRRSSVGGLIHEDCGYFCEICQWSNAGSRPVRLS